MTHVTHVQVRRVAVAPILATGLVMFLLGYYLNRATAPGLPEGVGIPSNAQIAIAQYTTATLVTTRQLPKQEALPKQAALPKKESEECPVEYRRMTVGEIKSKLWSQESGRLTYLFGNHDRLSGCRHCNRTEAWAQFCQFKSHGPTCPSWAVKQILSSWIQRGYELPLTLTPCDLWRYLRGRTLVLVGDSMMLDFYKGMHCFMMEMWTTLGPGEWDLQQPLTNDKELAEELTTNPAVPPKCVPLLGGTTKICYVRTDKGDDIIQKTLPLLLKHKIVHSTDLLIVNFGLHHDGKTYPQLLSEFTAYVAQHRGKLPRLFWQQVSAQHFATTGGEYGGGKPPFECKPILNFTVEGNGTLALQQGKRDTVGTLAGQWRNKLANKRMSAAGIPIIPSFNETVPMSGAHRDNADGHECTHYCFPSAPELWVASFYRALQEAGVDPGVVQGAK